MTKEYSRRDFLKIGGLVALAMTPFGCATTRPELFQTDNVKVISRAKLGKITEKNSRYHVHPIEIFKEGFYLVETNLEKAKYALFKKNLSMKDDMYRVNKNGEIIGWTARRSGEGGLYLIENELDSKGNKIDSVKIDPRHKKPVEKKPVVVEEKDGLKILCEIEKDNPLDIGVIYFSKTEPYVAVKEEERMEGFYDFHIVPVDKMTLRTQNKKFELRNMDNILRPKFYSWDEIKNMVKKEVPKKRQIIEETLKETGYPTAIETSDINNK